MTRKQKNDQTLDAYLTRCQAENERLNALIDFIKQEKDNGRSPQECRAEVARRWPGTRYSTFLQALENVD